MYARVATFDYASQLGYPCEGGVCCSWLSMRPASPGRGGCIRGFWLEQAHADEPPVVIDALDRVSVQRELGDNRGREVNPAGVQLGKSDRLVAGLAQSH
jgi:hypothetical protein